MGTWLLMGFILQTIYKSNLNAVLTTQRLPVPFETFEELLRQNILPVTVLDRTYLKSVMMVGKVCIFYFPVKEVFRVILHGRLIVNSEVNSEIYNFILIHIKNFSIPIETKNL